MPDHMAVLARHPLPWRMNRTFSAVLDANGGTVISDSDPDVGEFIIDAANEYEERLHEDAAIFEVPGP